MAVPDWPTVEVPTTKDTGSLYAEYWTPIALTALLSAILSVRVEALEHAFKQLWGIPAMLAAVAELAARIALKDPAPWCSSPFGYVSSISKFSGVVAPQGQAFLLVLLTSILLASVFNVRNRGGNSSGLAQQTLNRIGRCEWGGLARLCRDSCGSCCGRHYYPWAGGGELLLILGSLLTTITGCFPYTNPGMLSTDHENYYGQIKWWHNQGIVLGIAIAVGGTLLILLEWAISFRRKRDANDWISLGAIGCLFVLLVVSIVGYLKPNYLPPYRKLWSPPSNAYVCYLHLTQTDCEYPGYGQAELPDGMWPCHWNASVAQPMRPCVSMVTEDDDATALKCTQHGIPNYRATLWEVHMLFVAVCLVNGVLAYVDFFAKKEGVGFNAAFAAAPVAEPQGETELAEVDQA